MIPVTAPAYDFPPFRPPNEARSALIRVTRGCPWNRCLFCTMYKGTKFEMKGLGEIKRDIDRAAEIYGPRRMVFIADSDSLVHKDIEDIMRHVRKRFPTAESVTSYARARTLKILGAERLKKIRKAGLSRVHVGLESGDAKTLEFLCKGVTPGETVEGGRAAKAAGLELSFYVLIGAGGPKRLEQHALGSAKVCNQVDPDFVRLRTLVVEGGSLLELEAEEGNYEPTSPQQKLKEVSLFLAGLSVTDCELASDHFTNNIWLDGRSVYNGIYGTLPRDKNKMLEEVEKALAVVESAPGQAVDATVLNRRGEISHL